MPRASAWFFPVWVNCPPHLTTKSNEGWDGMSLTSSSLLDRFGGPFGKYFNWIFLLIPEKCPYNSKTCLSWSNFPFVSGELGNC